MAWATVRSRSMGWAMERENATLTSNAAKTAKRPVMITSRREASTMGSKRSVGNEMRAWPSGATAAA